MKPTILHERFLRNAKDILFIIRCFGSRETLKMFKVLHDLIQSNRYINRSIGPKESLALHSQDCPCATGFSYAQITTPQNLEFLFHLLLLT